MANHFRPWPLVQGPERSENADVMNFCMTRQLLSSLTLSAFASAELYTP
jgi:hypothetical protein